MAMIPTEPCSAQWVSSFNIILNRAGRKVILFDCMREMGIIGAHSIHPRINKLAQQRPSYQFITLNMP